MEKLKKYWWIIFILIIYSCGSKEEQQMQPKEVIEAEEQVLESDSTSNIEYYEDIVYESTEMELEEIEEASPILNDKNIVLSSKPIKIVSKYEMGKLVYNIPHEMVKLETYNIVARISRNEVDLKIYDGIKISVDTIIRTSESMKIELIDPTGINFKIVSNSPIQFIDINEYTEWNFYVTPLKRGDAELKVIVSIMKNGVPKQDVYNDTVSIKTTSWLEARLWLAKYWQWFFAIAILPLSKLVWNKRKNRDKLNK